MFRDEIVLWLRLHAPPTANEAKVIGLLCKLREGRSIGNRLIPPAKRPAAILEFDELRQLLLHAPELRLRMGSRVQFSTMSRGGDVLRVQKADLFESGRTFLRGGKGDYDRYTLMDPATCTEVLAWLEGEPMERRLFEFSGHTMWKYFKLACKELGLLDKYEPRGLRCTPHMFRHNAATHCHAREMPVDCLESLLGHSKLETTVVYVRMSLETMRERYLGSRREFPRGAPPTMAVKGWDRESLEKVLQFILTHIPPTADLNEVIRLLCLRCMERLKANAREFVGELLEEAPIEDLLKGFPLPVVLPPSELATLIATPDDALDATLYALLYATGMRPEEPLGLAFTALNPAEQTIRLPDRLVLADPATFERLRAWQGDKDPSAAIFPITLAEAERRLHTWTDRTGIGERYRAMGRTPTLRLFRHAFGSHRFEAGMDILTLKLLMGHLYPETTGMYTRTAVGRFRAEYLRCHPLANGAITLPKEAEP